MCVYLVFCLFVCQSKRIQSNPIYIYIYLSIYLSIFLSFLSINIYIYGTPPLRSTLHGVSNTFQTQCNDATKHLLASMQPNICVPQCYQTFAWLNATKTVSGHRISCSLLLDKFRLGISDLRFSSLNSSSTDPRSKISENSCPEILDPWIQDPRFQKTLVQKSWIHGSKIQDFRKLFSRNLASKIQDFRKLLSRNLGSMDPRSKISENSCPEILDPSRNLGSMDPTPKIHGSKISGQEFSEILDLGS